MDDYEYYKLGCKVEGQRSIGRKRFLAALARYERDRDTIMARIDNAVDRRKGMRLIVHWTKLVGVMATVKVGKIAAGVLEPDKVAATSAVSVRPVEVKPRRIDDWRTDSGDGPSPDPGSAGVGVPRLPLDPIHAGSAARAMTPPVYEYDRAMVH